jgi:hypothetical protein
MESITFRFYFFIQRRNCSYQKKKKKKKKDEIITTHTKKKTKVILSYKEACELLYNGVILLLYKWTETKPHFDLLNFSFSCVFFFFFEKEKGKNLHYNMRPKVPITVIRGTKTPKNIV